MDHNGEVQVVIASGVFRKSLRGGDNSKEAHLPSLRALGRKGVTGPQGAAGRLRGTFVALLGHHLRSICILLTSFRISQAKKA